MATYTKQPSTRDARLKKDAPNDNTGAATYFAITGLSSVLWRSILNFDISDLPAGVIDSVKLKLYYYDKDQTPDGKTVWAYKVTRDDWVESEVTWNSYKSSSSWTAAGSDYVTSNPAGASTTFPSSYGWMEWDIKAIVEDAIDNVSDSVNLLIKFDNEADGSWARANFYSSEYTDNTDLCPKIVIEYSLGPSVTTQAASGLGDGIATLNGNVTSDNGHTITERGFYCDKNASPTTKYVVSGTTGAYTKNLTSLDNGDKYYFKAFATNSEGTSYGSILDFTPNVPAPWLSGWDKRIKITADNTKVDANLSHFPLTFKLGTSVGIGNDDVSCVFDELTTNDNRKKIAVTKSDGTTELYVEIEQWDDANEKAVLHAGLSGDTLSSSADTDYYLYYDKDHADNTAKVGDTNSTPAESVWDSNFKMVQHLADGADTSHTYDSTSNDNDGTKKGAGEPTEIAGQIGQAQDFNGSDEYVILSEPPSTSTNVNTGSISAWIQTLDAGASYRGVAVKQQAFGMFLLDGVLAIYDWGNGAARTTGINVEGADWHYICLTFQNIDGETPSNNADLFIDGDNKCTVTLKLSSQGEGIAIGSGMNPPTSQFFNGIIDEVRLSSVVRTAAWIKATYNSGNDSLFTYGSEEEAPSGFIPTIMNII
ncbi:MAG: DNRLRE domain-containing protein [Candidatus Heimdallarchaeaceae archaeon]